ncbi:hypothetical protein CCP3SC15_830002 [Gammaproteobacteria bacterium]
MAFPAWLAAIVQVPAATPVTVLALTVHIFVVVELKVTARLDVAVALTVVVPPTVNVAGKKEIVPMLWSALITMFLVTRGAGL